MRLPTESKLVYQIISFIISQSTLTLLSIHVVPAPLAILRAMPTLQDGTLITTVLMKVLHLVPCMPLSLLNATLENEYLLLLGGELALLVTQGRFYPLEYLNIVLFGRQCLLQIYSDDCGYSPV